MRKILTIVLTLAIITAFSVGVGYFLSSRTSTEAFNWSQYSEEQIGTAKLACALSLMGYCSENQKECDEWTCKYVDKKKNCKPADADYEKFIDAFMDDCAKNLLRQEEPAKKRKKGELLANIH